ncbi:hypothetical protein [Caenimonas sedimenti]|nr:hypothetical protein [Caenimonas sedimenti]
MQIQSQGGTFTAFDPGTLVDMWASLSLASLFATGCLAMLLARC